jgi:hypothetical protein
MHHFIFTKIFNKIIGELAVYLEIMHIQNYGKLCCALFNIQNYELFKTDADQRSLIHEYNVPLSWLDTPNQVTNAVSFIVH